jgi:hypothetical protein
MNKTIRLPVMVLIGFSILGWSGRAGRAQTMSREAGFQLLDRLVVLVVKAAAPGGGGGDVGQEVVLLAKNFQAIREAGQVDALFAVRYSRMLSAVRQSVLMDPEVLRWPMYRYSMADFIEERTGRALLGAGVGLGTVADAVMSEIVSLHIHLENLDRRPDILKTYIERGMKAAGVTK